MVTVMNAGNYIMMLGGAVWVIWALITFKKMKTSGNFQLLLDVSCAIVAGLSVIAGQIVSLVKITHMYVYYFLFAVQVVSGGCWGILGLERRLKKRPRTSTNDPTFYDWPPAPKV